MTVLDVCAFDDLEPNSAQRFDIDGHRLAIVRFDDDVFAMGDKCSHADFSLAEGELDVDDRTLECWKHGSTFSIDSGEPTCLPATKSVPVFEAAVSGGRVQVTITTDTAVSGGASA